MENRHELSIGIIVFEQPTVKYLPYFFDSLLKQNYKCFDILVIDNSKNQNNKNYEYIKEIKSLEIDYQFAGSNLGFAKAYNLMVKRATDNNAKYFLAINPDIILEEKAVEKMIEALKNDDSLGSISPKILKWDFDNRQKTKIIDSCGIKFPSGLRFVDLGQGEIDKGQYDDADILGPSGAAAMYRISALKNIKDKNGYFDENMFMYKEDSDLAYRLFLAGYKSKLVPGALVYHDRTAVSGGKSDFSVIKNRKNKSKKINEWSFLNQQIIFWKFWRTISWKNKSALIWRQIKILIYILFFEPYLFKQLWSLYKIRKKVKIY